MEAAFTLKKESPVKRANIFSKITFWWMVGLFYKGIKRSLVVSDLYKAQETDRSDILGDRLEDNWKKELEKAKHKNTKPSLLRALTKTFIWGYMFYGVLLFIMMIGLRCPQPLVLSYLIKQFLPGQELDRTKVYASAGVLVGISAIVIFLNHHTIFGSSAVGMRLRIASSALIYRKIIKLNKKSLGETAAGQVVNLLSNDVNRFDMVCIFLHYLWVMPFQIALLTFFLWEAVGVSCLSGVLSMALLTLPVQAFLAKLTSKYRLQMAQRTDSRVKVMNEIISGIQVIKMYAWEKPFEKVIAHLRKMEVNVLTKSSYLRGVYLSCMVFIERTTLFLTVITYVLSGNDITADVVFAMAQYFNLLQMAMAIAYPMAIGLGAETWISIKRLENFLALDEREASVVETIPEHEIKITNLTAAWVPDTPVLKNLNIHIPQGKLCAVVGPVGSGKSSLLQLLLGELSPSCGRIQLGGEISYASQEAWLFQSTVRSNILFGKEYKQNLYRMVVDVCALKKDFEQFSQGDKTIVGERGVSLSGGQRARINLARAIYRQADVYLLDDPLSAVDTHVGKHLFKKCIVRYLHGKTRILVTHQLQYLKQADIIIVLNEGNIEAIGTFEELSKNEMDFTKLLAVADETTEEQEKETREENEKYTKHKIEEIIRDDEEIFERIQQKRVSVLSVTDSLISMSAKHDEDQHEEVMDSQGISPFTEYLKSAGNICKVVSLITALIAAQAACAGADYWVAYWTNQEALRVSNKSEKEENLKFVPLEDATVYHLDKNNSESLYYNFSQDLKTRASDIYDEVTVDGVSYNLMKTNIAIYIYSGFIIAAIVLTLARSILFFKVAMSASRNLHKKMFHCLLEVPMKFFDNNPSGRVLNRFSKDMGSIDDVLPRTIIEACQVILVMCGILVNVTLSNYYMAIFIVIFGALFLKIRQWYILTAKSIKHIEGVTKSPVFSHINSTLNGLSTIRASKAETTLIHEFDQHQDVHTSAWYLTITCMVSFGLWLDIICVFFIAFVTFGFALAIDYDIGINSSLVGLAISQSLILTGMLQYGMRQSAEVVNQLTSVERVFQYTKLETEGPFITPKENLPKQPWPSQGKVQFKNLNLTYVEGTPVLKNLNFTLQSGEKVGIVGRTGAGKSSLIAALFRLTPLEGTIFIDDVDTNTIGLSDLRKKISIIPQEPVLFSATLRYNLDPFQEFEDAQIWKALEEVELKDACDSLDFMVKEGGSNFSLGQRQLLCLARAILRNNKILVLDEATANVDPRTDGLIQTTIRQKFAECTVITIAHRLNTIMDSDKVMVMGGGEMLEFDHPHRLLQIPDGHFHRMVLETGPAMTLQLKDVAMEAWEKKSNEAKIREIGKSVGFDM